VFGRAWRIGSIGGVDIRVDSSWVVIAALITYSEWVRFTDAGFGLSHGTALGVAIFAAGLFFGSVLAHELAHAGMARARGIQVMGITLFLYGGATSARVEEKGPGSEFLVTVVGPGTSFALAAIFWVLGRHTGRPFDAAFQDLARVNAILAVFNLVPGFPLDGGRILRSIIWKVTGSLDRATQIAAICGQVVGAGLIAAGLVQFASGSNPFALWLAFIGFFLLQAARGSARFQRVRQALAGGTVAQAMRPPPLAIPAQMSLSQAFDMYLRGRETELFPVVDGDRVVGMLSFDAARTVGQHDPLRPVRDAMLPLDESLIVRSDERLDVVSDRLTGHEAMVADDGRLVGTISTADLNRWLAGHRNFTP
jgi:Zn-dependent protease/CBS domain-containing protein